MRVLLVVIGMLLSVGNVAAQESPPDKARIRQLIDQLGDSSFVVREAAQRTLMRFVEYAADELGEATESRDLEQALRAKLILGLSDATHHTHRVVDALDRPIKTARVVIKQGGATQIGFTDRLGRFAVPSLNKGAVPDLLVEVRHAEYGSARWHSSLSRRPATGAGLIECKMPLVHQGSDARRRAVQGKVVDGHGQPVVGAVLHCPHVRTQGEGLITANSQAGDVITDGQGRFALYLAANKPNREPKLHGDLVPPGSRYSLSVRAPGRDDCFPVDDMFSNDAPVEIRMPLATRLHRLGFAQPGGGELTDTAQLTGIAVDFYPIDGDPRRVRLATEEVVKGRKLIPGKYVATRYVKGQVLRYLPLRVEATSPEVLTFQLPRATVYRGRAVHGVTGKPVARSWAAAIVSTARANLAELSNDDWRQLRIMPDIAGPADAATKILSVHYGIGALVRADDAGRFEITEPPGIEFYGIMAFAENFIPLEEVLVVSRRARSDVVALGDFPLFPAATLHAKVLSAEKNISVAPEWKLEADKQPAWIERFRTAADRSRRHFCYSHWMRLNEVRPIFIPSGVRLRVEFSSPYDARWGPAATEVLQAHQGELLAGGAFSLPKALPVSVRVVDQRGKPIEGLAVRSRQADVSVWSIAHNTDAKGLAHFFFPPKWSGKFRVDLKAPRAASKAETIETTFQLRDNPPKSPIEIRLTDEQVLLLQSAGTKKKP